VTSPPVDRSRRAWSIGLGAGALLLRLAHVIGVRDTPLFSHLFIDPAMYDEWARAIAGGRWLSEAPFFLDPLYPYWVGLIYAGVGPSLLAVALIQCVVSAMIPVALFDATERWYDRSCAATAGVFAAVFLPAIYWTAPLMKPTLAAGCFTLVLWSLARAMQSPSRRRLWVVAGAGFAATALLRGNLLLVFPLLLVWLLLASPWNDRIGPRGSRPRRIAALSLLVGGAIVLLLPAAHNLAVSREFIVATVNHGQIFYIGNNAANPSGRFDELPFVSSRPAFEQRDFKREAERRVGRPLSHRATSRFWFGEGLDWVRANPMDWLRVSWNKLRVYWGAYETPASLDYYFYREFSTVLRLPLPGFGVIGPLALLGCALTLRRRGWPRLLVLLTALSCLAVIQFFVLTRFRIVSTPAMLVLAGVGATECVRRVRRWRTLLPLLLLLPAAWAFVNLPVRAPANDWSVRLATRLSLPTRPETTALARYNLGLTYAAKALESADPQAWLSLAEAELRHSLSEEQDLSAYEELGKVLANAQRNAEAIEAYEQFSRLDPLNFRPAHALGLLHLRTGDTRAAEAFFRRATTLEPRFAPSSLELGKLLLKQGRMADAAGSFERVLALNPGDREAQAGLQAARQPLR